uniref:Guanylate cyclase domain-containing protein n=1 Tax=Photinus pyralis TaxID=7054 RepID=A0A1Y1MA48_PHOPY
MSTPISQIMNKTRARRSTITGNILRETQALRKFEISQIKKQIEILATFLPDFLIKIPHSKLNALHHFVGVFLFADISGFTALCEKYNKTGKGGTYRLTATLNAFVGAIVEVIYFYGGDVLKFSGDAFLALWKAEPDECLYRVIHQVIVCALFIQQHLGRFQTEVNVLLKAIGIISITRHLEMLSMRLKEQNVPVFPEMSLSLPMLGDIFPKKATRLHMAKEAM